MKIYSHSKLSTFEQCPFKFKLRYIDKIIPEIEETIESHLGRMVHKTLEWLYKQVKKGKIPTIDDVITYYAYKWKRNYKPEIPIVKNHLTAEDYFNNGIRFLVDYYTNYHPFDDNTLEVEKKILINLDEDKEYKIQGFIDRLVHNLETGEYEVHDYKTANNMPRQEKIENDRQLALYSIAIKELFGKDKGVCLVWHYLAHNKKICSRRTDEQLEQLKKDTLALIKQIEATTKFPPYISRLCDWCEYKNNCPAWSGKPLKRDAQDSWNLGATKSKTALLKNRRRFLGTSTLPKSELKSTRGDGQDFVGVQKKIESSKEIKESLKQEVEDKKELDIW